MKLYRLSKVNIFIIVLFASSSMNLFAQGTKAQCNNLQNGTFYIYPKNSAKSYVSIRNGNMVKEVEINTKDTSYWQISWQECAYIMKFISSSDKALKNVPGLKDHKFIYQVRDITPGYYTYKGYLD